MRSNKIKDMIRSVLPSTDRKGARKSKSGKKRSARRRVRLNLRTEDFDESKADFRRDVRLSYVVAMRRSADKVNPLMRWCRAKTEGMDTEEALGYVRGILPSSLIGDHAYFHWELERRPLHWRRGYRPSQTLQSFVDSTTFRLERALAIAPDLHHALNAEIKRRKVEGDPRRLLLGIHDVEAFVRDVAWPDKRGEDDLYYIERGVTLDLIERIEKGGREAALQFYVLHRNAGPNRYEALRVPLTGSRRLRETSRSFNWLSTSFRCSA
ncbi:MAG TPA: hypothetical protein VF376_12500 [Thermoanaerobaculia bacterium]